MIWRVAYACVSEANSIQHNWVQSDKDIVRTGQ